MEEIACKRHMGIWETLIFDNLTHQLPFDMVEIGSRRGTQKNIAGRNIKREVEEGVLYVCIQHQYIISQLFLEQQLNFEGLLLLFGYPLYYKQ